MWASPAQTRFQRLAATQEFGLGLILQDAVETKRRVVIDARQGVEPPKFTPLPVADDRQMASL